MIVNRWYVKVKHYRGGESVIGVEYEEERAQAMADNWMEQHQSNNAYIELHDPEKVFHISGELMEIMIDKIMDEME